ARITGRNDVRHPGVHRSANRLVQTHVVATFDRSFAAKTQIGNFDCPGVSGHPINSADDVREFTFAVGIEHANGPQTCAGGDADDTAPVVEGSDSAGDVRAMAVLVV